MLRKKSSPSSVPPQIPVELLDSLVKGPMSAEGVAELIGSFKKALLERVLQGELSPTLWGIRRARRSLRRERITAMGRVARPS